MTQRVWTGLERERLRAMVAAGTPQAAIAAAMGRTLVSVRRMVARSGFARKVAALTAARCEAVARFHAAGLNPAEIARRMGVPHRYLRRHYRALNLTPHRLPVAERARRSYRSVRLKHRKTLAQLRSENDRVAAVAAGWPPLSPALTRRLGVFFDRGPATTRQHTLLAGGTFSGCQSAIVGLVRDGHLTVVGVANRAPVYDLAPAVRERRRAYLALTSTDIPE